MKLTVSKQELQNGLGRVAGAIAARTSLPILANLLVETEGKNSVKLVGTDLEIAITTYIPADVQEEGSVTTPAKKLYDIVRELPEGDVSFAAAKNSAVHLECGKSNFRIMGLPKDDFPEVPAFTREKAIRLSSAALREGLRLTAFAVSRDETRYVLNGILMHVGPEGVRLVATDGRRLAFYEKKEKVDTQEALDFILPTKAVQEVAKLLEENEEVELVALKNQVLFHFGKTYVVSRLIEGHFPNYEQVIPKEERTRSCVDREKFLQAVRRAQLLTSPESQSVKVDLLKGKLLVSSRSPNLGEAREELEAEFEGTDVAIGFNPQYLQDVLKNLDVEKVTLGVTEPDKPGLLKGKDDYLYVIMPMQLT